MNRISGIQFREMLESGVNNLNRKKKEVDALNVFPVPDGDTGTNMSLTVTNGMAEVKKAGCEELAVVAKTFSRGLLMGARGNSGVITSQIFRGFADGVAGLSELDTPAFAKAMQSGTKRAYKAVMRPVEGTILTVVREASEQCEIFAKNNPEASVNEFVDYLVSEARTSLDRTPELLPVLKEANVVDSGGCGLLTIFEGFKAYLDGHPISDSEIESEGKTEKVNGYCVEIILSLNEKGKAQFNDSKFRKGLSNLGDEITVLTDETTVKVRVNTLSPGEALNFAQRYGEFEEVQISNLSKEKKASILDNTEVKAEQKELAVITCCAGEGLAKLFKEYRADYVVSGGQTMNPSTEDFVGAVKKLNAKTVFILPNNSNIIMAAKQAADVLSDYDIRVIESKSIPQGLSACINFNPEDTADNNEASMKEAIKAVKSGSITYAIKDTSVDGQDIHAGDYMGIFEKDIKVITQNKIEAAEQLMDLMVDDDSSIITIVYGSDASEDEINAVTKYAESSFDVDVDIQKGDQPVYSFVIGVE